MMERLRGIAVVAMTMIMMGPVRASAQDPAGIWTVTFVQSVTFRGSGAAADTVWAKGELALTTDGTGLAGTWKGVSRWRIEGTFIDGQLRFWTTELMDDDPRLRRIHRIEWEGVLRGGRLDGMQRVTVESGGREVTMEFPWRGEK